LENQAKLNPIDDPYNARYPFDSMESLLEAVHHDLELYKAAKKTQHRDVKASSNLYKIENNQIAKPDPVIPGQRNPQYPYAAIGLSTTSTYCDNNNDGDI